MNILNLFNGPDDLLEMTDTNYVLIKRKVKGAQRYDFYQLDLITSVENILSSSNQYDFGTSNHTLKWLHTFKNETNLTGTLIQSLYSPKNLFPEIDSDNVISFESNTRRYTFLDTPGH